MNKRKEVRVLRRKGVCFQIAMLIISLFAFSFIMGEANFVQGAEIDYGKFSINSDESKSPIDESKFSINSDESKSPIDESKFSINSDESKSPFDDSKFSVSDKGSSLAPIPAGDSLPDQPQGSPQKVDPGTGESYTSEFFRLQAGSGYDALATGAQWAVIAFIAGQLVGSFLGLEEDNTNALSTSLAAGLGVFQVLDTYAFGADGAWFGSEYAVLGEYAAPIGLGVAAIVFALMYKDTKTETVTFACLPWQAPSGGNNCEVCNDDDLPCSEYRCLSLGQNCELVNKGTEDEACVNVNPNDVDQPIISPDEEELTPGLRYTNVRTSPPSPGFTIVNDQASDGCLQPFTPLKFGILTNEPSQCKIDFDATSNFDEMATFFGGSNLYSYNHSEQFVLPNTNAFANSSLVLENGKDLTLFIRCRDKAGNENTNEFAVNLCIDPSPDTTPPKIEATSIRNGACVAEDQDTANVEFYTDEPAECRWSTTDQTYDLMPNDMVCKNKLYQLNAQQLFTCSTTLEGIARDTTDFYVRCKDQPGIEDANRNKNEQSYVFTLRGSTALVIKNVRPNASIFGGVDPAPVELYAETLFGCNDGRAICYYSTTGEEADYIQFFDTNTDDNIHTQRQDLSDGDHEYFIQCIDEGGNVATKVTNFNLEIDASAPDIARIYEEDNLLKIVTVRDSECSYSLNSCDFTVEEGEQMPIANTKVHVAEWNKDRTYYIKCRDQFKNEDASCSAIVKPTENFL